MSSARTLLVGATIRTLDPSRPTASAVAVSGGRIVALDDDALALRGTGTEVIDLAGATITPGLVDGHSHPLHGAFDFNGLDLTSCQSLDDLRAALATAPDHLSPDGWLQGFGLDHNVFGGAEPTNDVLDEALPGVPISLRLYDCHSALASSTALARAGVDGPREFRQRAYVACDASGAPTGHLIEPAAMALVNDVMPMRSRQEVRAKLLDILHGMAATGLTGLHAMDAASDGLDLLAEIEADTELPVWLRLAPWCMPGEGPHDAMAAQGRRGRRWHVAAVKFFMDGTIEGGTAWLEHADCHGESTEAFWRDPAEYTQVARYFAEAGVQTVTHAIGDAAVRHVVETLGEVGIKPVRHRIEHLETLPDDLVQKVVSAGLVVSMQPPHVGFTKADLSDEWSTRLGAERAELAWRCRDIRDAGGILVLGSDWPVADYDARKVLAYAQLRREPGTDIAPVGPAQALTPTQALEGMTTHSAIADNDTTGGRIAVGRRADLAAFAVDPIEAPADEIAVAPVRLTMSGGFITHSGEQ